MVRAKTTTALEPIENLILTVRGYRVILDADLARIYGVPTKALNQAVKRNIDRFPTDFLIQFTKEEWVDSRLQFVTLRGESNRSQIVTGSQKHRDLRLLPYAFTEHGAIMVANILRSKRAVQMSVSVVRAFVRMRSMISDNKELAVKLAELEQELKKRLDTHETAIIGVLQRIMRLIDPPPEPEPTPKEKIGFRVGEPRMKYTTIKRRA